MKIGEVAKQTGLSVSNIRFYEKKGLLNPRRREENQYREYESEDIRRLKEIMLLRKLGMPLESIYLLYQGQAEFGNLIRRQEEELKEQMEQLEGALNLCKLLEGKQKIEQVDVDTWLHYVQEEEGKGRRFAEAEEFLEDLAEFSRVASFRYDPYVGRFFQNHWVARTLAVLLALCLVMTAISVFVSKRSWVRGAAWFWVVLLLGYGFQFYYFRRRKRREEEEEK